MTTQLTLTDEETKALRLALEIAIDEGQHDDEDNQRLAAIKAKLQPEK